jgi:uncharacterized protein (DUF1330 family)
MGRTPREGHMAIHIGRRKFMVALGGAAATWALKNWYNSADYQAALKIGQKYATFRRYAVEGQ